MIAAPDDVLKSEVCWPTLFFHRNWGDHAAEAPGLVECLYGLRAERGGPIASGVAARAKSGEGMYESGFGLFAHPHEGLRKLMRFVGNTLALAVSQADGGRIAPPHLAFAVAESWFHISNGGGFHDAHHHHNCSWCGIYYLQLGDAGGAEGGAPNGGSRFYSPLATGGGYRDVGNRHLLEEIDVPIREGMLLLFPSYLQHAGLPYSGAKDRIVIAFNAQAHLKDRA